MNVNTGELLEIDKAEELAKLINKPFDDIFVKVDNDDMTEKQKESMTVSLKDHRSILGKKLTEERIKREISKSSICICGSGKKYKNCCRLIKKQLK